MDYSIVYIVLGCLFGFLMTWGIGANDFANIMSTSIGSKAIDVKKAIVIAIVFELAGAYLGGSEVSNTLRHDIINTTTLATTPELLVYGMLAVLLAGTIWMVLASYFGMPVSITHAIVGAIVGFGSLVYGLHAIYWKQVLLIAISWLLAPTIAAIMAHSLFLSVQRTILATSDPLTNTQRLLPIYLFVVGLILTRITIINALEHFHMQLHFFPKMIIILTTALMITGGGILATRHLKLEANASRRKRFLHVEKMFAVLMSITACAMIFAHGANDISIAVGPMAVIINIATHKKILLDTPIPAWLVLLGTAGVILGLLMYGQKIIATVGSKITALTPSRAFAATLSAALTIIIATSIGIPVSATQTLVGAILGVGLARGIGALNLHVVRNILMSWIVTLPAASLLAMTFFYMFQIIFT